MVATYPQLYEEYIRIYDLYLKNPILFEKPPFVVDNEIIKVQFHETKFELKKPVYTLRLKEVQNLYNTKTELMKQYDLEKKKIIYSEKNALHEIKDLTKSIHHTNQKINELTITFDKMKSDLESQMNDLEDIQSKSLIQKKDLFETICKTTDDVSKKTKINQYLNMSVDDTTSQRESIMNKMLTLDDYMVNKPVIISTDPLVMQKEEIKVKKTASQKLEKKIKEKLKKTTPKTEEDVKKEWKTNLMKGLFGSLSDCKSTKHSKPYYLSKAQMYSLIEKDPEVKKKVGKMYKKMSRDELCDKLML